MKRERKTPKIQYIIGDKKRCAACKEYLSFSCFSKDSAAKHGLAASCKKCHNAKVRSRHVRKGPKPQYVIVGDKKLCGSCDKMLGVGKFGKRTCSPCGLLGACKDCENKKRKRRAERNGRKRKYGVAKVCSVCKKLLPVTNFVKSGSNRDGWQNLCKRCKHERDASSIMKRNFDIVLSDYNKLLEQQDGLCAICRNPETRKHQFGTVKRLAVDHNHDNGKVRGLLCSACNTSLGLIKESQKTLSNMIDYLRKHEVNNGQTKATA